jgi:hypothetical protein
VSSSFLATVRQQAWYPQVEAAMANAGVPEALWVSTIASENPGAVGTSPAAVTQLNKAVTDPPGFSYGLFQFHNQPAMVDPIASGNQAASIMGKALQSLPSNASPQQQLTAIEQAAWPGNDPKLIAKENPARVANLTSILAQEQSAPIASIYQQAGAENSNPLSQLGVLSPFGGPVALGNTTQNAASNTASVVTSGVTGIQGSINNAVASIQASITAFGVTSLQVAIALAVVAGGFALLSSGGSDESVSAAPAKS